MSSQDLSHSASGAGPMGLPDGRCKACFRTAETEPVLIRWGGSGEPWVESSIRRCANDDCWNTTGGTLEERLQHVRNVYDYKYFGDYELTPKQNDAVREALAIAEQLKRRVDDLTKALAEATPTPNPGDPA